MKTAAIALAEIVDYLEKLDANRAARVELDDKSKNLYLKFQALLLFQIMKDKDKALKDLGFFDEFLSDSSAAYFFLLTSAYKPSIAMLRSSIENLLRSTLISQGVDISEIESVRELFECSKSHFKSVGNTEARKRVSNLHGLYGDLCKTVHSVSFEFMSLRVPFSRIFEFDELLYGRGKAHLISAFQNSLELLYIVSQTDIQAAHFKVQDAIRDAVPPRLKAHVARR